MHALSGFYTIVIILYRSLTKKECKLWLLIMMQDCTILIYAAVNNYCVADYPYPMAFAIQSSNIPVISASNIQLAESIGQGTVTVTIIA